MPSFGAGMLVSSRLGVTCLINCVVGACLGVSANYSFALSPSLRDALVFLMCFTPLLPLFVVVLQGVVLNLREHWWLHGLTLTASQHIAFLLLWKLHGGAILPSMFVDIAQSIDIKEKMLACHESQRNWLLTHHNMDEYILSMKRFAAQRGKEIGTSYAEGFRQHLGHGHPQNNILKEILGNLVLIK